MGKGSNRKSDQESIRAVLKTTPRFPKDGAYPYLEAICSLPMLKDEIRGLLLSHLATDVIEEDKNCSSIEAEIGTSFLALRYYLWACSNKPEYIKAIYKNLEEEWPLEYLCTQAIGFFSKGFQIEVWKLVTELERAACLYALKAFHDKEGLPYDFRDYDRYIIRQNGYYRYGDFGLTYDDLGIKQRYRGRPEALTQEQKAEAKTYYQEILPHCRELRRFHDDLYKKYRLSSDGWPTHWRSIFAGCNGKLPLESADLFSNVLHYTAGQIARKITVQRYDYRISESYLLKIRSPNRREARSSRVKSIKK